MSTVKDSRARLRTEQAEVTRLRIVEAASALFTDRGYVATTIGAIAEHAGVVVQTVYNAVGNKAAVLNAVFDRTVSGDKSPTPVPDFMRARMATVTELDEAVAILSDWLADVNARAFSMHSLIRQAAAVDTEVAELEQNRALRRLHNYEGAAELVRSLGGLGESTSNSEAAATIWSIGHPDAYRALVLDSGWSQTAYRAWIGRALMLVLAPGATSE